MLFSLFYLAGYAVFLRGLEQGRISSSRATGISALYALSLLSKEMAASFPLTVILGWFVSGRRVPGRSLMPLFGVLGLLTMLFITAPHLAIGRTSQTGYLSGSLYAEMLTMTRAAAQYLELGRLFPASCWPTTRTSKSPGPSEISV